MSSIMGPIGPEQLELFGLELTTGVNCGKLLHLTSFTL